MKRRLIGMTLILALVSAFVIMPGSVKAQTTSGLTIPVSGSFTSTAGPGTFTGKLTITQFAAQNGHLVALGTLSGTLKNASGDVLKTLTNQTVTVPLTRLLQSGTACQILTLDVGAIHLNLLGLVINLSPIHLTVTAQQGPGNLLGNLLCTVAHLLDGHASMNAVAAILNSLLRNLHAA